jgi:hypothetical protein
MLSKLDTVKNKCNLDLVMQRFNITNKSLSLVIIDAGYVVFGSKHKF